MSAPEPAALWDRLRGDGLVDGDMPADTPMASPWFVRAMLGVAGWIGAAFLLAFVALGLDVHDGGSSIFVGVIACGAGGAMLARRASGDFASQFGFAMSLAGQGLILFGLADVFGDAEGASIPMGLFQAVLFFAVPSFVHRIWTAWTAALAFTWLLVDAQFTALGPALVAAVCGAVWLGEYRSARTSHLVRAGGYGLSLAVVTWLAIGNGPAGLGMSASWAQIPLADRLAAGVLGGAALLWVCDALIREQRAPPAATRWVLLAPAAIAAVASLRAPGLAPAVLLVLVGFGRAHRPLLGLGIAAVLGYLSAFYYSLEATLLVKSAWLAATGLALLAARAALFRHWRLSPTAPAETRDA